MRDPTATLAGGWTTPKHSLLPSSTADLAIIPEGGYHLIIMLGKEVLDRKFSAVKGTPVANER